MTTQTTLIQDIELRRMFTGDCGFCGYKVRGVPLNPLPPLPPLPEAVHVCLCRWCAIDVMCAGCNQDMIVGHVVMLGRLRCLYEAGHYMAPTPTPSMYAMLEALLCLIEKGKVQLLPGPLQA